MSAGMLATVSRDDPPLVVVIVAVAVLSDRRVASSPRPRPAVLESDEQRAHLRCHGRAVDLGPHLDRGLQVLPRRPDVVIEPVTSTASAGPVMLIARSSASRDVIGDLDVHAARPNTAPPRARMRSRSAARSLGRDRHHDVRGDVAERREDPLDVLVVEAGDDEDHVTEAERLRSPARAQRAACGLCAASTTTVGSSRTTSSRPGTRAARHRPAAPSSADGARTTARAAPRPRRAPAAGCAPDAHRAAAGAGRRCGVRGSRR
jgi:hypothetical protein